MEHRPHRRDGAERRPRREGRRGHCPHTTPSDLVRSPRKSTAAPFPSTEGERPSAPVTAGDPDLAKTGVVAHGAHGILKECSNDLLQRLLLRLLEDRLRLR